MEGVPSRLEPHLTHSQYNGVASVGFNLPLYSGSTTSHELKMTKKKTNLQ